MSPHIVIRFFLQPAGHILLAGVINTKIDQLESDKQPEPLPYEMSLKPEGVLFMMAWMKSIRKSNG
jgi:hypothetical protein